MPIRESYGLVTENLNSVRRIRFQTLKWLISNFETDKIQCMRKSKPTEILRQKKSFRFIHRGRQCIFTCLTPTNTITQLYFFSLVLSRWSKYITIVNRLTPLTMNLGIQNEIDKRMLDNQLTLQTHKYSKKEQDRYIRIFIASILAHRVIIARFLLQSQGQLDHQITTGL